MKKEVPPFGTFRKKCITSLLPVIRTEFFVFKKNMRYYIRVLLIHACVDHTGLNINYIIIMSNKPVCVAGEFLCPVTGAYYAAVTGKAHNTRDVWFCYHKEW